MRTPRLILVIVLAVVALSVGLAAQAQQMTNVYRIGWLQPVVLPPAWVDGFRQGLRELGYVEAENVRIEYRWADGKFERLPDLAGELVRLEVDVLVSGNTPALQALRRTTTTIPIVMLGPGDPVGTGLIESLARPGGNVTGMTTLANELSGKRLGLLRQLLPGLSRVACLANPANPLSMLSLKDTEAAAGAAGVSVHALQVHGPAEFGPAFSAIIRDGAEALTVAADSMLAAERGLIVEFAAKNRLPSIFIDRVFVDAGGLMAYGPSFPDTYRRAAGYVDKILRGAKPADLPVEQPTKFELVVNMKAAKALGLTIPPSVLAQADEVIE